MGVRVVVAVVVGVLARVANPSETKGEGIARRPIYVSTFAAIYHHPQVFTRLFKRTRVSDS